MDKQRLIFSYYDVWGIYRSSVHEFRLHNAAIQSRDCVAVLHILEIALPPCVISRLVLKLRIPNVDCVIQSGDCFKIASYLRSDFLFLSKHVVLVHSVALVFESQAVKSSSQCK